MSVLSAVKRLSITAWLYRRVHPSRQRAFQEEVDLYRALLPPGSLCFDVGANVGEKSDARLERTLPGYHYGDIFVESL